MTAPKPHKDDPRYWNNYSLYQEELSRWEKGYESWGKETCKCKKGYFCEAHGEWVPGDGVRRNAFPSRSQQRPNTCHPCPRCNIETNEEHTCGRQFSTRKRGNLAPRDYDGAHSRTLGASSSRQYEDKGKHAAVQSHATYDYSTDQGYLKPHASPPAYSSTQSAYGGSSFSKPTGHHGSGSAKSRSRGENEYQYQDDFRYKGKAPERQFEHDEYNEGTSKSVAGQSDYYPPTRTMGEYGKLPGPSSIRETDGRDNPYDPYAGQSGSFVGGGPDLPTSTQYQQTNTQYQPAGTAAGIYDSPANIDTSADQSRSGWQYPETTSPYGGAVASKTSNTWSRPGQTIVASGMGQAQTSL